MIYSYSLVMNTNSNETVIPEKELEMLKKLNSANKNAVIMTIQGIYLAQKNTEEIYEDKSKEDA